MSTSFAAMFSTIAQSDRVPCFAGSALNDGAQITVNSGVCAASSPTVGTMKRLRTNRLCQAYSLIMRTGRRYSGSAPAWRFWTNSSLSARCATTSARRAAKCSGDRGRFTLPHWMCASLDGSLTTNLSFGERPVC